MKVVNNFAQIKEAPFKEEGEFGRRQLFKKKNARLS
jgi:hypothetical protein